MKTPQELQNNEGAVMTVDGQELAVYKDEIGAISYLFPICTHAGCTVQWNNQDKTWDCPCHGSRYTKDGKVMNGPAQKDLVKMQK